MKVGTPVEFRSTRPEHRHQNGRRGITRGAPFDVMGKVAVSIQWKSGGYSTVWLTEISVLKDIPEGSLGWLPPARDIGGRTR